MNQLFLIAILINGVGGNLLFSQTKSPKIRYGTASFYADKFNGRRTANGEVFSQEKMTAASNTLSLNTWARVTNLRNQRSVVVRITDRMHHDNKRLIDLSRSAASLLGYVSRGLTRVKVEPIKRKVALRERKRNLGS